MIPGKEIWAEQVLASAEGIVPAKAPAGFYEKTIARLKATEVVSGGYVLRVAAGVLLLVAFNAFACVSLVNYKVGKAESNLSAFAKEYSIAPHADNF